ncbi:unnamed protein product, partial [Ixodes pacificus]
PTKRELSVVLERLEECLIFFPRIKTSTPLKSTAAVVAPRLPDFSESESLSDEHEPQTKIQKLRKAKHTFMDDILTTKSDSVRARRNGAGTALAAREDVHPSGASEDDDSSYRPPSETDTESTSHESNSEWEEFTSDGTSSTSTEISNRPSSRMSTRAKRNVNGGTSSGRRFQRLELQSSRSKSDNVRAKASGQAHPRRPVTGKELSDRDDGKVKRQQKKDTSRTKRKSALERRFGAKKKQVPHSPGVKNIARKLKIVEQGSNSSWEESSSVKSMEDTESQTNSRDKRTQLGSVKHKQHAHSLFNNWKKGCRRITKSKAAATRREHAPRRSSSNSDRDSECSQEKDTAQSGNGPLSTNREGSQHVTKRSKTLGSKRKRESSNSGSRKSEAATQPRDSESFRFAAKNLRTRSPAEPHGGYTERRKSLRARRESLLSSQYSSDSPDDSDDEPSHLQRNAMSQSSEADIAIKRQSVNGSRIRLARKSIKALLSEQESASSDSSEGWLPVHLQRTKWEESECSSGNEQRKSGNPLQRKWSSDFITLQAGKSQVARGRHVGAKRKNAPLSGSSSLLDESSDDFEDSKENGGVRRGSRNKQTGPRGCRAQPARLARRQYIDTKEQRVRDSDRNEDRKIFVGGKPPRTGNVHLQVRSRKPKDQITRIKGEDEISQDTTTSLEGSGDDVPFSQIKNVTKPQSRQPATRKQTKLLAFAVGAKKKGRSRSPLVAAKHGDSSHDHSSNSQQSGDSSGNNWKSGIVQRPKRGVSSTHPGSKESRAHPMRLTKKKSTKRKRRPSSSSSHSTEEDLTTESETCQISSRDPRAKSLASKQRSLKSGIGTTQDKKNPVIRRSSIRTKRDNNLTARKQPQTVVVQVRSRGRPRGSSAAGRREATPPSLVSGTMDSSSKLNHSRKNKVAQSKAVLGEQRGTQENSAQLKVITSASKKTANCRSRSFTEESVTLELESEGDEVGLQVHSTGPEPRPVQPETDVTKVGRKCMTGGSPVWAKDDDKSLRGSSSLSEACSDGSGYSNKKASTQSQTENLPARNRLRQRTAIPVKKVHAARSSVVAAGRTFSPFLSGPVHDDNHLEQSQKKIDVRPGKKITLSKTFARPVNVVSKTVVSKGHRRSKRQAPGTATRSRTVPTDQRKLQAQPAVHEKHPPQDGTEETQVAQGRLTRSQLIKARSESMSPHGSLHTLNDGEIKQFQQRTPTLIAKNSVAKGEHTPNQVCCVSDTNKETELKGTPKQSESVALHKHRPTTSKELGKAQLKATMPAQSRSTIERGQLRSIPNSSAAGNHSSPVKTMGQNANSEGDSKIVTRNTKSRVQMQTSSSATQDTKTKRGTRQKNTVAEKRSTSGKHATVTKELSCSSPSAVNSSNRSTHLQEETRTRSSEWDPMKRNLIFGTNGTLPEKAAESRLTAANQQKGMKKEAGSSSAAGKSADLRVEKEEESASKVVSQPKHSDGPSKQHKTDLAAGTSPSKVGKSVAGAMQEKQTPLKPRTRQRLGAKEAIEQASPASRPRRKCTTEDRKKAAAPQKRDQGTAQKQRTQTASINTAKSVLEMGGTITCSKKQSKTFGKTKGPIKPKVSGLIAAKLRGKKTSEGMSAQPAKMPNSRTDSYKLHSVSCRGNTATPVNQRRLRASKERNEKLPPVNQATERCSSIAGPKTQRKAVVGDRSSSPGILLTTLTASKRTKAAARRKPTLSRRRIELPLATAAVTAGKGTLKRKRQLRKVAEALAAAAAPSDDIYGSSFPSPKRMISDFLFRKDPREAAEDSLMVAGMRTPQLGSVYGSPGKNSPGVSLCSATSSPFRAAEEIVHAIQKQTSVPYTSSTPKAKQKSHGAVKNLLGNLNELEGQLQTVREKKDRLGDSDVELDYFSEDSSAL